jgi:MoaA/NifB/PqqE/SkfB family radical SAM enzyme
MCRYWDLEYRRELSTDEIKDILSQARREGVEKVAFYGGEPLLREDLVELIAFATALKMQPRIITNGLLAQKELVHRMVEAGLEAATVSIDAYGNKQAEIRGVTGAYEKAAQGLDNLLNSRRGDRPRVYLAALLMGPTLGEDGVIRIVDLAVQKGIPVLISLVTFSFFYFRGVDPQSRKRLWIGEDRRAELVRLVERLVARKKKDPELLLNSLAALRYIERYFRDPESRGLPCYRAYGGIIWVDAQGGVYGCQGLPAVGDLRRESLRKIISSDKWRRLVRDMFSKRCPGCSCDYASNVDADLRIFGGGDGRFFKRTEAA